ncbi:MAG: hypothetical protein R3E01_17435 [Pirellulaceae bacterium]|nr:hypothetical protein [Planctomycetales bacterium]
MNRSRWQIGFALLALLSQTGCGDFIASRVGVPKADGQRDTYSISTTLTPTPQSAIQGFLRALQNHDVRGARMFLTSAARLATNKNDLTFVVPNRASLRFQLGDVHDVDTDSGRGAYVTSYWLPPSDSLQIDHHVGNPDRPGTDQMKTNMEVVWVLREESHQWRIAGLALRPSPDKPHWVMDFEDPATALQTQQRLRNELPPPTVEPSAVATEMAMSSSASDGNAPSPGPPPTFEPSPTVQAGYIAAATDE